MGVGTRGVKSSMIWERGQGEGGRSDGEGATGEEQGC